VKAVSAMADLLIRLEHNADPVSGVLSTVGAREDLPGAVLA